MKSRVIFLTILTFPLFGWVRAQSPVSIYKNLRTVRFYSVNLSASNGKYEVNGEPASKQLYEKYKKSWDDMGNCCPCLLQSYNQDDVLLSEEVSCTDCGVGAVKEFYPDGRVKMTGQYKENNTGSWDRIYERGYCNIKTGDWKYYDEAGNLLYTEYWKNGEFVKQSPEQSAMEIWKVDLLLNGQKIDTQQLTITQVPLLTVAPSFKNKSRNGLNLSIRMNISALNYKVINRSFTIDSFKNMDLLQLIHESGFPPGEEASYYLIVLNNDKQLASFRLNIKF